MARTKTEALIVGLLFSGHCGWADQHFSQEVFFENSVASGSYPYSRGNVSAPSTLRLVEGKLPVETAEYVSGPNALELQWQSMGNGGWDVQLNVYQWRNREINWVGDSLFLWLWSDEAIAPADLPRIALIDLDRGHTSQMPLGAFTTELKAKRWTRVRVPLARFTSTSLKPFATNRLSAIVLAQGVADARLHGLYLDDIRIENSQPLEQAPKPPTSLEARGYERHVDLHWQGADDPTIAQYVIYRSLNGGAYKAIGVQRYGVNRYADYVGDPRAEASYKVSARTSSMTESPMTNLHGSTVRVTMSLWRCFGAGDARRMFRCSMKQSMRRWPNSTVSRCRGKRGYERNIRSRSLRLPYTSYSRRYATGTKN